MTHRLHLHAAAFGVLCAITCSGSAHALLTAPAPALHHPARVVSSADLPVPEKQRAPFGWQLATITTAEKPPLVLQWEELPQAVTPTHFRIAVGLDERDAKEIEVTLAGSGRRLGTLDVRFPAPFQVYQMKLSPADVGDIMMEGVALRLTKGSDLEIFVAGPDLPAALLPHLLVPGTATPMEEFYQRLNSLAVVQQFGWMEGCVLEGLLDLSAIPKHAAMKEKAQRHLDLFFRDSRLVYEDPKSVPNDGRLYGIEGGLPFAALARLHPQDARLELPLAFWESRRRPTGSIQDGGHMSTEGTYTIAYPMALIARQRGDEKLMQDALYQCRIRQARFFDGQEFWRTYDDDGKRGNRNWARGIAWQMLGLVRTLEVARERRDIGDLILHLQKLATWTAAQQREDGLWSVIVNEPKLTTDTAGSAGIAAALALGARNGWLDASARSAAQRTLAGLEHHLTPDGFLDGVSPSNKGGLELQRSDYRAIFQMGMGLMAQLIAALEQP